MASRESQINFRGYSSSPEGVSVLVPFKGLVGLILKDLIGNIKSRFFLFSEQKILKNFKEMPCLLNKHLFGQKESSTHIFDKSI